MYTIQADGVWLAIKILQVYLILTYLSCTWSNCNTIKLFMVNNNAIMLNIYNDDIVKRLSISRRQ